MLMLSWLIAGLVFGALYVAYARSRPTRSRAIFGCGLVIAALAYFVFVVHAPDPMHWMIVEGIGLVVFGSVALLGIKGSLWWLAAGWATHPVWDIGLHYLGGASVVPAWYAIACVSFDWVVAAYIAYTSLRKPIRETKPT
jgi:hypothetical protein